MAYPEPDLSIAIGSIEIALSILVFHFAIPAQMAPDVYHGLPIGQLLDNLRAETFSVKASPSFETMCGRMVLLPFRIVLILLRDALSRLMLFKFWALGVTLGTFGVGRSFPPYPGVYQNYWFFIVGHFCLIFYTSLKLFHLSRLPRNNWWFKP